MKNAISEWFSFSSKSEREKKSKKYAEWAFPYGEEQKKKIEQLILELFPKDDKKLSMVAFLTAKEAYIERLHDSHELGLSFMREYLLGCGGFVKAKNVPLHMALVLADNGVDEALNYPSSEDIRAEAQKYI